MPSSKRPLPFASLPEDDPFGPVMPSSKAPLPFASIPEDDPFGPAIPSSRGHLPFVSIPEDDPFGPIMPSSKVQLPIRNRTSSKPSTSTSSQKGAFNECDIPFSASLPMMTMMDRLRLANRPPHKHFPLRRLPRELRDAIYDAISRDDNKPEIVPNASRQKKKGYKSKEAFLTADRATYNEYCDARFRHLISLDSITAHCPGFNASGVIGALYRCSKIEGRAKEVQSKIKLYITVEQGYICQESVERQVNALANLVAYCEEMGVIFSAEVDCKYLDCGFRCSKLVSHILNCVPEDLLDSEQLDEIDEANFVFHCTPRFVDMEVPFFSQYGMIQNASTL